MDMTSNKNRSVRGSMAVSSGQLSDKKDSLPPIGNRTSNQSP